MYRGTWNVPQHKGTHQNAPGTRVIYQGDATEMYIFRTEGEGGELEIRDSARWSDIKYQRAIKKQA